MGEPEKQARPLPPIETRFKPGVSGNPGGVPRGTKHASPRRALLRALGKDFDKDKDAESEDDRIGSLSLELAEEMIAAARAGDADRVRSIATVIDQAEGKPQERVEHSGSMKQVIIEGEDRPENPEPL